MAVAAEVDGANTGKVIAAVFEEEKPSFGSKSSSVFEPGKYSVVDIKVETSDHNSAPPKSLHIASPEKKGKYPVILFLHGFCITNTSYTSLLQHIASHGFIVVAPQLYSFLIFPYSTADISSAAAVADWLPDSLQSVLPDGVKPNLSKLSLAGHSRGGHAAFSLALGYCTTTAKFSVLLGIDPVGGFACKSQIPPKILSDQPGSFNLEIPVLVVGSGLESQCAPEGVNHQVFFYDCKPPRCHMIVSEYGHMDMLDDMLDDVATKLASCVCKKGKNEKDRMRRSIGGIVVAFLRAHQDGDYEDLRAIVKNPEIAPASCSICYEGK